MTTRDSSRPQVPVIVFDGICVLCNGWVRFLLKHDREGRYRFAAMQTDAGRALLAGHGLDPDDPGSFLKVGGECGLIDRGAVQRVVKWRGVGGDVSGGRGWWGE